MKSRDPFPCLTRRGFLARSTALFGAGTVGALSNALLPMSARAADVSGYRALVCIFLLGGMDGHDTVIPYDQSSHDEFTRIRDSLYGQHGGFEGRQSRPQLLALTPHTPGEFGGRQFALPPELSGIHSLYESGQAAIVGNVGPLLEPVTRPQIRQGFVRVPSRLFSHNDQQSTWMASSPEGAQYGWGGRFADAAVAAGANRVRDFTAITSLGNEVFLTGESVAPYQIGLNGAEEVDALRRIEWIRRDEEGEALYQLVRQHFRAAPHQRDHLIERDMAMAVRAAFDLNASYNEARANLPTLGTEFPDTHLGRQLRAIAEAIAIRDSFEASRQVFFAAIGGFDSHSGQANALPGRHAEIDAAVSAFYQATVELGVAQDVTTFTASDFGRTLAINGDGTDHGWGNHHFVVGGAVEGGRIYGDIPPPAFEHDFDMGQGRLIPTTSVEQFAAPLGRWFGLNDGELAASLPRLGNFGAPPVFV